MVLPVADPSQHARTDPGYPFVIFKVRSTLLNLPRQDGSLSYTSYYKIITYSIFILAASLPVLASFLLLLFF